ncbi:phosphoglucosamine mutase [Candidatus Acidulodesulfobacterium sp. H_13]|uniref:phosphoglucosamine mutase n=1 Tax=Candidatus Acidulodesulfobacterium sp. H_13 TaxID=3395470 RepID=UPI003AF9886B
MKKLFGTDGIRGQANRYPLTSEVALKMGMALVQVLKSRGKRPKIVIGKDTRISGYMLETALSSGICAMGSDVYLVGPMPTPGVAFITSSMRADAGVVISASHNPFYDNGIKFFNGDGFKLYDEVCKKIEDLFVNYKFDNAGPTGGNIGKAHRIDDAAGRYVIFTKLSFPKNLTLNGLKIVVDCANGANYKVAPEVFSELGADIILENASPDGININDNCGSTHPDNLSSLVKKNGADVGLAFDGDGDRVIFSDENGKILQGDEFLAICAINMKSTGELKNNGVVTTPMSNIALELLFKKYEIKTIYTKVGDRYIMEEMIKNDYNLGGEQSGHIIFLDNTNTGDGIISALKLLTIMVKTDKPLSELRKIIEPYPQALFNVEVPYRKNIDEMTKVSKKIDHFNEVLKNRGRIFVRYSGTQNYLRVLVEGKNDEEINRIGNEIEEEIERYFDNNGI